MTLTQQFFKGEHEKGTGRRNGGATNGLLRTSPQGYVEDCEAEFKTSPRKTLELVAAVFHRILHFERPHQVFSTTFKPPNCAHRVKRRMAS